MTSSVRTEDDGLQQIRKLTEVSRALTYAVSLDEVLQLTVDRAVDLLGGEKSLLIVELSAQNHSTSELLRTL